jgi:plasmid stabilization system protein ParE
VKRLRLTPEAELDVDEAHLWYHRQAPNRATDFLAAVKACLATIQRHPQAFMLVDRTMRRALVRRFPYAIFYEIWPRQIVVYGVSTEPGILKRGNGEATHNFALERTRFARRSPRRSTHGQSDWLLKTSCVGATC